LAPVERWFVHNKREPPVARPHRARPGGAEASAPVRHLHHADAQAPAPPGRARWGAGKGGVLPFLCRNPRSTGASPAGTTDGAKHFLVRKPSLHCGKPGGRAAASAFWIEGATSVPPRAQPVAGVETILSIFLILNTREGNDPSDNGFTSCRRSRGSGAP